MLFLYKANLFTKIRLDGCLEFLNTLLYLCGSEKGFAQFLVWNLGVLQFSCFPVTCSDFLVTLFPNHIYGQYLLVNVHEWALQLFMLPILLFMHGIFHMEMCLITCNESVI